jgi:predicted nucleic acid-binding protein
MDLLDRVAETGAIAPMLWPLEALNGLFAAERRRRLDAVQRSALAAFLRELPIRLDADTAEQAWEITAGLAERFRLTVYDAAYLELAQRRRLPLASLDKELRQAATAVGVDILGQG